MVVVMMVVPCWWQWVVGSGWWDGSVVAVWSGGGGGGDGDGVGSDKKYLWRL